MIFLAAATVLAASLLQVVIGQGLQVNTLTSVVLCEPVQITWHGGVSPYYVSLIPGGQPGGTPYEQFSAQNGYSYTWIVNLPLGTTFTISLRDNTGQQAFSDIQTVLSGPDSSCLGSSTTSAETTTTTTSTDSSAASTNTATSSSPGAVTSRGTSITSSGSDTGSEHPTPIHVATSSASSTTASSTSSSNAAPPHASAAAIGMAGLLGLAGAALLG